MSFLVLQHCVRLPFFCSPVHIFSFFLQHCAGADPNWGDYDRRTPLHLAAADGNIVMVRHKQQKLKSADALAAALLLQLVVLCAQTLAVAPAAALMMMVAVAVVVMVVVTAMQWCGCWCC